MSQTQLQFRKLHPSKKFKNYKDVQRSVNALFEIFEEYGRLEKLNCGKTQNIVV